MEHLGAGVYAIMNTTTGDCYIGMSHEITWRYKDHLYQLRRRTHPASRLQAAWNEYGEASFTLVILQAFVAKNVFSSVWQLPIAEAEWCHALQPAYNGNRPVRYDRERGKSVTPPALIKAFLAARNDGARLSFLFYRNLPVGAWYQHGR